MMRVDEPKLAAAAAAAGAALDARGLSPGDRVGLLAGNVPEFLAVRDALAARELVAVPLNPKLSRAEVAALADAAGARLLLVHRDLADRAPERPPAVLLPAPDAPGAPAPPPGIGATLLFTSGTTGAPKGCLRGEPEERARAEELIATYGLTREDVHLVVCPLAHSAPGIFARAARLAGAATVLLPRFRPEELLSAVEAHRATVVFLVPTQISRLLALPEEARRDRDLSSLRAVIVAGAPFPAALKRRAVAWLGEGKLWEFYGSSETGTVTVLRPEGQLARPGSVGRPPAGTAIRLLGEGGREVAPGEVGEVYVRSPALMAGYLREEAARTEDGFLSVGDLARLDEDGYLYLVDRKHDTIISGGVNVHPAEVERALAQHPDVAGAVAFGVPDDDWGEIVAAAVAVADPAGLRPEELIDFLRDRVAGFKIPRALTFVRPEDLPVGASGKPQRRKARELLAGELKRVR